jgi:hypothetical protein
VGGHQRLLRLAAAGDIARDGAGADYAAGRIADGGVVHLEHTARGACEDELLDGGGFLALEREGPGSVRGADLQMRFEAQCGNLHARLNVAAGHFEDGRAVGLVHGGEAILAVDRGDQVAATLHDAAEQVVGDAHFLKQAGLFFARNLELGNVAEENREPAREMVGKDAYFQPSGGTGKVRLEGIRSALEHYLAVDALKIGSLLFGARFPKAAADQLALGFPGDPLGLRVGIEVVEGGIEHEQSVANGIEGLNGPPLGGEGALQSGAIAQHRIVAFAIAAFPPAQTANGPAKTEYDAGGCCQTQEHHEKPGHSGGAAMRGRAQADEPRFAGGEGAEELAKPDGIPPAGVQRLEETRLVDRLVGKSLDHGVPGCDRRRSAFSSWSTRDCWALLSTVSLRRFSRLSSVWDCFARPAARKTGICVISYAWSWLSI